MITPKEKAEKLIHYYVKELLSAKYRINGIVINDLAKQCALICCDEVLGDMGADRGYEFWSQVKDELQKL
jgi:hypothetical protein